MPMNERVIIGFDPGLADSGYGVMAIAGSRVRHLGHGVISSSAADSEEIRLLQLYTAIKEVLTQYAPTVAGIESIFFAKNVRSAIPVAQARGVILVSCAQAGIPVYSFSPPQIKQSLTGVGRADKAQVQQMVQFLFGLASPPESNHAADALAAAYCVWQKESVSGIMQL